MPTLYWGPWLAKIRHGGPVLGMYFDAVVVKVETFILLFRLALAIL